MSSSDQRIHIRTNSGQISWLILSYSLRLRIRLSEILSAAARIFRRRPESPDDPYSRIRCPKGPRLPHRSAAIALEEPYDG